MILRRLILGFLLGVATVGGVASLTGDTQIAVAAGWMVFLTIVFWSWGRIGARGVDDVHGRRG
jgi:4-hydroxybenzoate polyprenyltransferase